MARSNQTDANNVETHTEATGISQVTAKTTPIAIKKNALHFHNFNVNNENESWMYSLGEHSPSC